MKLSLFWGHDTGDTGVRRTKTSQLHEENPFPAEIGAIANLFQPGHITNASIFA